MHPTNFNDWERVFAERWGEPPQRSDASVWHDFLTLLDDTERLGFDKVWTTEHRESPYGMIPNPLTFLSMVAGRTETIGVGTQVVVVPWWAQPIRIAEEIAMVDAFLEGRELIIGFGRGVAEREFKLLAVDRGESRGRFMEGIEVVKKALLNERFSHHGEFFDYDDARLSPRVSDPQKLVDGMVGAFSGTESADAVARAGLGMITITGKPARLVGEDVTRFNGIRQEKGLDAMQPIIQTIVICCETQDEADRNTQYFTNFVNELDWHYHFSDPAAFEGTKGYEAYLKAAQDKSPWASGEDLLFCGTPDAILARFKETQELTSAREFIINPMMSGMPLETARKSLALFAKEVLPEIHAMEPTLHPDSVGAAA
jgi:alkanesulfonate monooxygenase SsuD/methylene tetrahydromethanopterin reductase-like flavin-dependent oxidoreductase (luciferase family)